MFSANVFVIVCLTLQNLVTCQEVDCSLDSPELWLKDVAGELHTFTENITDITELQLEKGAAVSTTAGSGESLEAASSIEKSRKDNESMSRRSIGCQCFMMLLVTVLLNYKKKF